MEGTYFKKNKTSSLFQVDTVRDQRIPISILWTFFRGGKDEWMEWVNLRSFYLFSLDSTTSMCIYYKKIV